MTPAVVQSTSGIYNKQPSVKFHCLSVQTVHRSAIWAFLSRNFIIYDRKPSSHGAYSEDDLNVDAVGHCGKHHNESDLEQNLGGVWPLLLAVESHVLACVTTVQHGTHCDTGRHCPKQCHLYMQFGRATAVAANQKGWKIAVTFPVICSLHKISSDSSNQPWVSMQSLPRFQKNWYLLGVKEWLPCPHQGAFSRAVSHQLGGTVNMLNITYDFI